MLVFVVFVMLLCASVYRCFVVTCWDRADLLAFVLMSKCELVTFPLVSCLVVSIPDICPLSYFYYFQRPILLYINTFKMEYWYAMLMPSYFF